MNSRSGRITVILLVMLCLYDGSFGTAQGSVDRSDRAEAEIRALEKLVSDFAAVELPAAAGKVELSRNQALTIQDLHGVRLDSSPPELGDAPEYDPRQADDYPPGKAPYVAEGIRPFRFDHFNCEFSYGGWHNFEMTDYASAHGFNIIYPYIRSRNPELLDHLPEGTEYLNWGGGIKWAEVIKDYDVPEGRFDRFAEIAKRVDMVNVAVEKGKFKKPPWQDYKMIDIEHGPLAPQQLREQSWYPNNPTEAERESFEKNYYKGFALTYILPVRVARRQGWDHISIYGWQPFRRTWHGLSNESPLKRSAWRWELYGKGIYRSVDLLNPSVYCFYRDERNIAYTLATIDMNMQRIGKMPKQKPVRPYYWTLLHGGGSGWRWWEQQPIVNEDVRAMTALGFFTGFDGFVTWNWSGTGNHHQPGPIEKDADLSVGQAFSVEALGGNESHRFVRYDVIHVLAVDGDQVTFQPIIPGSENHGVTDDRPMYRVERRKLKRQLRAKSDPVSAMIEGMALTKPLEYILSHGKVKIDVPAQKQWQDRLPIVRRVKLGQIHAIATYDPGVVNGGKPRKITLRDFAGQKGRTIVLPADQKTRIFVLTEE